jgi:MOSC domain-containing protein YiiM
VGLTEAFERAVAALAAAVEREAWSDSRPAVVITGLRNPCGQIDGFRSGLLKEVSYKDGDGRFVRKAGVMGVVLRGGSIRPGDPVTVELPPLPHEALDRV